MLNSIFWVLRSGPRWRDLPELWAVHPPATIAATDGEAARADLRPATSKQAPRAAVPPIREVNARFDDDDGWVPLGRLGQRLRTTWKAQGTLQRLVRPPHKPTPGFDARS